MAVTTFVLFQYFNVFNARMERGSACNKHFFDIAMRWASLAGLIVLRDTLAHWPPAQSVFGTVALSPVDWGIATGVAASILILDEGRKLIVTLFANVRASSRGPVSEGI